MTSVVVTGVVAEGYRIASGLNKKGIRAPDGRILKDSFVRQRPFFEREIPELKNVWTGTINIDISPKICRMLRFDHEITCEWQRGVTETFGVVSGSTLIVKGKKYPGFIYYPFPSETKERRDHIIEILAPKIKRLSYGDKVTLTLPGDKITIE